MKKNGAIVLLIFLTVLYSSCFQIVEEVSLNADGSGTATTTIDFSEMMNMMSMFLPDSLKETFDMNSAMKEDIPRLKNMKGISNVKANDQGQYVYSVSYDFKDAKSLANANILASDDAMGGMKTAYTFKRSKVQRLTNYSADDSLDDLDMNSDEMKSLFEMMEKPTYTVVYNLPRKAKKVKVKGESAEVDQVGKKVTIEYNLLDFLTGDGGEIMNHCVKF